jgi:hypothetical protein
VDGLIHTHVKAGRYNGKQFMEWLERLLEVMNPYPAPQSVLILDNCRIHHVEGVEEMRNARCVHLFFSLPYLTHFSEESSSSIYPHTHWT